MNKKCSFCGGSNWMELPNPAATQSITTACVVINEPLGKAQCTNCGLVQRIGGPLLGNTDYYEANYGGYYSRPGTESYHAKRYNAMAEWIRKTISDCSPRKILDVGCGAGGAMVALASVFPSASISGLEPSRVNAQVARDSGFVVYEEKLTKDSDLGDRYDLTVSIYVVQHVTSPSDYFQGLYNITSDGGYAVVIIPKGDIPNIELLWADQNYAFTATHLVKFAEKAGFSCVALSSSPSEVSVSWLAVFGKNVRPSSTPEIPSVDTNKLFQKRRQFLGAFSRIDDFLVWKTETNERTFNFGASFWTSILGAYCPSYWNTVDSCLVDIGAGDILGKKVCQIKDAQIGEEDVLVLGVDGGGQLTLQQRFKGDGINVVTWANFID